MARVAVTISLSDDERAELEALSRRRKTSQGLAYARRSDRLGGGGRVGEQGDRSVRLEASADTVDASGVAAMRRRASTVCTTNPAPARRRQIGDDAIAEAVRLTLEETPPDATHWSLRSMAGRAATRPRPFIASGGPSACSRIARRPSSCRAIPSSWRRSATSSALYLAPPDRALASVSTKRARSRPWTVPSPSCRCAAGQAERRGHDYKRHGTTSLFALPSTSPRERSSANAVSRAIAAREFRKFLDLVEAQRPC